VDIREVKALLWITACCAGLLLVGPLIFALRTPMRVISLTCAFGLAGVVQALRTISAQMGRVFEVSPFGLSEIAADGSIRRLLWGYGLTLRNRPWLRRLELSPKDVSDHLDLPYAIVGFERLVELIFDKGGFRGASADGGTRRG